MPLHNFSDERLKELWQAEQKGRILILPLAIGDKAYSIKEAYNYEDSTADDWEQMTGYKIEEHEIIGITLDDGNWSVIDKYGEDYPLSTEMIIREPDEIQVFYPKEYAKSIYNKKMKGFKEWVAKGRPRA